MAIVSSRRARLQEYANRGDAKAKMVLDLLENPNKFLSTVQVGITLIGVLAGAFGGATLSHLIEPYLRQVSFLAEYSEGLSLTIVVIIITFLSLVIGELVPKRIALNHAEGIARFMVIPMSFLSKIASPIVFLLGFLTDLVLKLLRIKPVSELPVTEEEIRVLMHQGTEAGTFEQAEHDMVERIFRLGDKKVGALMTPRPDIEWIDINEPMADIQKMITESACSRFPVGDDELDNIKGIVQVKDLLEDLLAGGAIDLQKHMMTPLLVPENTHALKVLELFKQSRMHLALVIDEYGRIEGLVTLNDILEAIVGDIPSLEDSEEEPHLIEREDGSFLIDGTMPIDEFETHFGLSSLEEEEDISYQTLGGFVITHMGKIPLAGERFKYADLSFEIVDMDGNRVDKVLVSRVDKAAKPVESSK